MKQGIHDLLAKATPGPWFGANSPRIGNGKEWLALFGDDPNLAHLYTTSAEHAEKRRRCADAKLAAHCRNQLPRLLTAVKAEREALDAWRNALDEGCLNEEGLRLRSAWLATHEERDAAIKAAEEISGS